MGLHAAIVTAAILVAVARPAHASIAGLDFLGFSEPTSHYTEGTQAGVHSLPFVCASTSPVLCGQLVCSSSASSADGAFFQLLAPDATLAQLRGTSNAIFDPSRNTWSTAVILRLGVADDQSAQGVRNVSVSITCTVGGNSQSASATVSVLDNDVTPTDVQFLSSQATVTANEGDAVSLTLTAAAARQVTMTVNYRLVFGSSANALDVASPTTGSVQIASGQTAAQISFSITDDLLREGDERFTVELTDITPAPYGRVGLRNTSTIVIRQNDQSVEVFEFAAASREETVPEGQSAVLTIVRRQQVQGTAVIRWTAVNASSGQPFPTGSDVAPVTGTVTFVPADVSRPFSIGILADNVAEVSEVVGVHLSVVSAEADHPAVVSATAGTAILTVPANGFPGGAVGVTAASADVTGEENGMLGHVSVGFERLGGASGAVLVRWRIASSLSTLDSAASQTDFGLQQGVVVMEPNEFEVEVTIQVADDSIPEPDEVYFLVIWMVTGTGVTIDPLRRVARLTIAQNDDANGVVGFASPVMFATELLGPNPVAITLLRSRGAFGNIAVAWRLANATAHGRDVAFGPDAQASGTVSFGSLQSRQTLVLTVLPDALTEPAEEVVVELTSADGGARLNASMARMTLVVRPNDDAVAFARSTLTVNEGEDATVVISRTGFALGDVVVHYRVISGTALRGTDFTSPETAVIAIPASQTAANLLIPIIDDTEAEGDETFVVELTVVDSGDAVVGIPSNITVTIASNDGASGVFGFVAASEAIFAVAEGDSLTFVIGRNLTDIFGTGIGLVDATLSWELQPLAGSSRNPADDFLEHRGALHFPAGTHQVPLELQARVDDTPEVLHAYRLRLLSASADGRLCSVVCNPVRTVTVPANDQPHGVFSIEGIVELNTSNGGGRTVQTTIVRGGGSIGSVDITVRATFNGSSSPFVNSNDVVRFFDGEESSIEAQFAIHEDERLFVGGLFGLTIEATAVAGTFGDIPEAGIASIGTRRSATLSTPGSAVGGTISIEGGPFLVLTEPSTGLRNFTVGVRRTGGSYGVIVVRWLINVATPPTNTIDDSDFLVRTGRVQLAHGQTEAPDSIVLSVVANNLPEFNESFSVALVRIDRGVGLIDAGQSALPGVILENNNPYGTVQFEDGTVTGSESVGVIRVNIERSNGGLGVSLWSWQILSGQAGVDPSTQFTRTSGTVRLDTGDLRAAIFLQPIDDNIPELAQDFVMTLAPLDAREDLGARPNASVVISENDDAHGIIQMAATAPIAVMEGTGQNILVALPIVRTRGLFGNVTVAFVVQRNTSSDDAVAADIAPESGIVTIEDLSNATSITLRVQQDVILEEDETFVVVISIAPGSNGIVQPEIAERTVTILHNDDPIQFGPTSRPLISVNESDRSVTLQATRGGDAVGVVVVSWRAEVISAVNGVATPLNGTVSNTLTFQDGVRSIFFSISLAIDSAPQPQRFFRVSLSPVIPGIAAGHVLPGTSTAIVTVEANNGQDENGTIHAGGLFQFVGSATTPLRVSEGSHFRLPVVRVGGAFSNVNILWRTVPNCAQEFSPSAGALHFPPGVVSGSINTTAVDDGVPERQRSCVFELYDIVFLEPQATAPDTVLSSGALRVWFIEIAANDGIFGVYSIQGPAQLNISEDDTERNNVVVAINRATGLAGSVRAVWAVHNESAPAVPPASIDFLLAGIPQSAFTSAAGRPESVLPAYNFNGHTSSISLHGSSIMSDSQLTGNWTIALRMLQRRGNSGYLWGVWAGSVTNPTVVAALRSYTSTVGGMLLFEYHSDQTNRRSTVLLRYPQAVDNQWTHIALSRAVHSDGNAYYTAHVNGAPIGISTPQAPISTTSGSLVSFLGRARDSIAHNFFNGMLQEAGFFFGGLRDVQIAELAAPSSIADVVPVSGLATFVANQRVANFTLTAVHETVPEVDEIFRVSLVHIGDGGLLGSPSSAQLVIARSDNPNGRFIIAASNITAEEGTTAQIPVSRLDGHLGEVNVSWVVSLCRSCDLTTVPLCQTCPIGSASADLSNLGGTVLFADGQTQGVISIDVIADDQVEFAEHFEILLVSVTGGGRLDGTRAGSTIIVPQNGFPYGQMILQRAGTGSGRSFVVDEGTNLTFNAIRYGRSYGSVSVDFEVVFGNASAQDVIPTRGSVTLPDGISLATFTIFVVDDGVPERAETFAVRLPPTSEQSGLAEVDPGAILTTVNFTINENNIPYGRFGFLNRTIEIDENDTATFIVRRNFGRLSSAGVFWRVAGVNASEQLRITTGQLIFAVGQEFATIVLTPRDDDGHEPERRRRFAIVLFGPSGGATVDPATANSILTLASENDPHGLFSIEATSESPYDEPASVPTLIYFRIVRLRGSFGRVNVSYVTAGGTAMAGQDFAFASGTVLFNEGENTKTIGINLLPDTVPEGVETAYVRITDAVVFSEDTEAPFASGETSPRVDIAVAPFAISANDFVHGVFFAERVGAESIEEGRVARFTIHRSAGHEGPITLAWMAPTLGTFTPSDLNQTSGTVLFADGVTEKSVSFLAVRDDVPEIDEPLAILLDLVSQVDAALASIGTAVIPGATPVTVGGGGSVNFTIIANDDAHGVFEFDTRARSRVVDEPESGSHRIDLLIQRTRGHFGTASVRCRLINQTLNIAATPSGVGAPLTSPVVFNDGDSSAACTLYIRADNVPELEEVYSVVLTDVSANARSTGGIGSSAQVLVRANDDPFGTFTFESASVVISEPTADERAGGELSVGEAEDESGDGDNDRTAIREIRVVRTGGDFGSATVLFRTRPLSGEDLLRDLAAQPNFLDDPTPAADSLLFRIFELPVVGRLTGGPAVPLLRPNDTRTVQGCALACALESRCVSLNVRVNGTSICELMALGASPSVPLDTTFRDWAHYHVRTNRAEVEQTELALARVDYNNVSAGVISFADGQRVAYATVEVARDDLPELQESFAVDIFSVESALRLPSMTYVQSPNLGVHSTIRANIAENDNPHGVVEFQSGTSTSSVDESPGAQVRLILFRRFGSFGTVDIRWNTDHQAGHDLSGARSGTIRFDPGERTKAVSFYVIDDSFPEQNETVNFRLAPASPDAQVSAVVHSVTILANDMVNGEFSFASSALSVVLHEPADSQLGRVVLPIIRRVSTLGTVRLSWAITGPHVSTQFNATSGFVDFTTGVQNTPLSVWLRGDTTPEIRSSFWVRIAVVQSSDGQAFVNALRAQSVLTVAANDDPYGVIELAPTARTMRVPQSAGVISIPVLREAGTHGRIGVVYRLDGVTAHAPQDFVNSSGVLVLEENVSAAAIDIQIVNDALPELDESFTATLIDVQLLSAASQDGEAPRVSSAPGAVTSSTITIAQNNDPFGRFAFRSSFYSGAEGQALSIAVQREQGSFGAIDVEVLALFCTGESTERVCAQGHPPEAENDVMWAAPNDTAFRSIVLTFEENETLGYIDVVLVNDSIPELSELFYLQITSVGQAVVGDPSFTAIQISESDEPHGEVTFAVTTPRIEAEEGQTVRFTFVRVGGAFGIADIRVNVTNTDGSAPDGISVASNIVQFEPHVRVAHLVLDIFDDDLPELNQTLLVSVLECVGTRCDLPLRGYLTVIANDDAHGLPVLSRRPVTVSEDSGFAAVAVARDRGRFGTLAARWHVVGGTPVHTINRTATFYATPVLDDLPFADVFVSLPPHEQDVLSMTNGTHGGHAVHYNVVQDDLVYGGTSRSMSASAADSISINNSVFVGTVLATTSSIYVVVDGVARQVFELQHRGAHGVVAIPGADASGFFLFIVPGGSSQLIRGQGGQFTVVQNVTLPLGTTSATTFPGVDPVSQRPTVNVIATGSSGATAVLRLESSGLLRQMYLVQTRPSHKWSVLPATSESLLIGTSSTHGVATYRFEDGRLDRTGAPEFEPSTPLVNLVPVVAFGVTFFAGRPVNGGPPLLLEITAARISERSITFARDVVANTMYAYRGSNDEARLVSCSRLQARCTVMRVDAIYSGANYAGSSGWVTFSDGADEAEIRIGIVNDGIPELHQDLTVILGDFEPTGVSAAPQNVTVTIAANDNPFGSLGFSDANLSTFHAESTVNRRLQFVVERDGGLLSPGSVSWQILPRTSDFVPNSGTLTFGRDQSIAHLDVDLVADNTPELSEVYQVSLFDVQLGPSLDPARATAVITIPGNDAVHGEFHFLSQTDRPIFEDGGSVESFTIARSGGNIGDVRVHFRTSIPHIVQQQDATPSMDYLALNNSIVILDGVSRGQFNLTVLDDAIPEPAEWLRVALDRVELINNSSGSGDGFASANEIPQIVAPSWRNVFIRANDDASGVFAFRGREFGNANEGTEINLTIDRARGTYGSVEVEFAVTFDTASAADVELPASTIVRFLPGQSSTNVTIWIVADGMPELQEAFSVAITAVSGGLNDSVPRIGPVDLVDVTIAESNDVRGVLSLEVPSVQGDVREGDRVLFNVTRSIGYYGILLFEWTVVAASGGFTASDVSPSSGFIGFDDGARHASFTFDVTNDTIPEGREEFWVVLSPAGLQHGRWDGQRQRLAIAASDHGNGVFAFVSESLVVVESNTGVQNVLLNVSRSVASFGSVIVDWQISLCANLSCANRSDLAVTQPMAGSLNFRPSETQHSITVQIANDAIPEHDEAVRVILSLRPGQTTISAAINPSLSIATITIAPNDDGEGVFGFASQSVVQVVDESNGPSISFNVVRQVSQLGIVHIEWSIRNSSGTLHDADFRAVTGVVEFTNGLREANFTVDVLDDGIPELLEVFSIELETRVLGVGRVQSGARAVIRINANDNALGTFAVASVPPFRIDDVLTGSGSRTGVRALNFTIERSGGTLGDVVAAFTVAYTARHASVASTNAPIFPSLCSSSRCTTTIPTGAALRTVSVDLPQGFVTGLGDAFVVSLSAVNHTLGSEGPVRSPSLAVGSQESTLVVTASDADAVVGFANSSLIETTEGSVERVAITRQTTRGTLVLRWALSGTNSDVTPSTATLIFDAGEATKTIQLTVPRDGIPELNETYSLSIVDAQSNDTQVVQGLQSRAIRVVANDDPFGIFSVANGFTDLAVAEGDQVQISLSRDGGTFGTVDVVVAISTSDGLTAGTDYRVRNDTSITNGDGTYTVRFVNGQSTGRIIVEVPQDATPELGQALAIQLVRLVHAPSMVPVPVLRGNLTSTVNIGESDAPRGVFRMANASISVAEDSGTIHLLVLRTGGDIGRATIRFETSPSDGMLPVGDSSRNVDFLRVSGTLVFDDGIRAQNISIELADDSVPEQNETFLVTLTGPGNGASIDGDHAVAAVTILSNDNPAGVISFSGSSVTVQEGSTLTVPVTRTAGAFGPASVRWQIQTRTGSDFSLADVVESQGVVTFEAGVSVGTIAINIRPDSHPEIRETFDLVLFGASAGAALGANTRTAVTIDQNGDPHGRIGFSCVSRYGGLNADGQFDVSVELEILRLGGTIGTASVHVMTTLLGSASSSEFVPLNVTVPFQEGVDRRTITLQTRRLSDPLLSKDVVVILGNPSGGAILNSSASTARVTIYATPLTAEVLTRVQNAVCSLQPIRSSAATSSGATLNQLEYDSYVRGVQDLVTGAVARTPAATSLTNDIFAIILNPANLGPDVRNNRGVPELLQSFARAQRVDTGTCGDDTAILRIGTFASVETLSRSSPVDFNGLGLSSDRQDLPRHAVQLPPLVFGNGSTTCPILTHTTYFSTAAFRTSARSGGVLPTSQLFNTAGFSVLQGRVISIALDDAAARTAVSFVNPLRFAVEYNPDELSSDDATCVRWSPQLDNGNGAWTTADCRKSSSQTLTTHRGAVINCVCGSVDAQHLAVLVPQSDDSSTAVAAIDQIGFIVLFCASCALVIVYFCCHHDKLQTASLQLLMQFMVTILLTQFFVIMSSNFSADASERGSQALAILLHLSFASQFTWVSAICFFLYTDFLLPNSSSTSRQPRFWSIAISAWGSALALVIVYLVSDLSSRDQMDEVYGWARDDKSFSLIPKDNSAGIIGALGGVMILSLVAVVSCSLRLVCTPNSTWLAGDDLFMNRSNRTELNIMGGLYTLHLVYSVILLVFIYDEGVVVKLVLLLVAIVEAVYILYFYAFTANVRRAMKGPTAASVPPPLDPLRDLISMRNPAYDPTYNPSERVGYAPTSPMDYSFGSAPDAGYLDVAEDPSANGLSRTSLSAGFQMAAAAPTSYMASSNTHKEMAAAGAELAESKPVLHSPYTNEDEFDDLIYTLQSSTFAGGEESTSQHSIDLDATASPDFAHKRVSIMDTHL